MKNWEPYGDGTSGHQGDSSQAAEPVRRAFIDTAFIEVSRAGIAGITWRELSQKCKVHHGQASSALSNLHRSGSIMRLQEKRDGCGIYVVPRCTMDRPTVPYRRRSPATREQAVLALLDMCRKKGEPWSSDYQHSGWTITVDYRPDAIA